MTLTQDIVRADKGNKMQKLQWNSFKEAILSKISRELAENRVRSIFIKLPSFDPVFPCIYTIRIFERKAAFWIVRTIVMRLVSWYSFSLGSLWVKYHCKIFFLSLYYFMTLCNPSLNKCKSKRNILTCLKLTGIPEFENSYLQHYLKYIFKNAIFLQKPLCTTKSY